MTDSKTTLDELKNKVNKFTQEREWQQFHSPKNLSMALAAEAAELMELFLWCESKDSYNELEKRRQEVEYEIADVAILILAFCVRHNIDLSSAIERKQIEAATKYPIEKSKGKCLKYNQFE
jgi:dCTP diphosphatase